MRGVRKDQITFTRFIAAIAIIIFHSGTAAFPFNHESVSLILKNANVGVSYFFTLSGFIMMLAYAGNDNIDLPIYYKSRFARIAPSYYVALALFVPFIVQKWATYDYWGIFLNLTMLQAWVPSKALSINQPGWSVSVEMLFYLLFPMLFNHVYQRKKLWLILLWGMVLFFVSQWLHHALLDWDISDGFGSSSHNINYFFPLMHLNEFVMGNIAGIFYLRYMSHRDRPNGPWIILSVVALLGVLKFPTGLSMHNGLLVLVFIPLILFIASDDGIFSRLLSLRPLVFLGEISFGIYILQVPFANIFYRILLRYNITDKNIIFYTYLIMLCLLAGLNFKYIETPLRKRINAFRSASEDPVPPVSPAAYRSPV